MTVEILMPQLGQAMVSGVILTWHVGDGETVGKGDLLLTIESDKSAFEIEAPASGRVSHKVAEGEEVEVGALLGLVGDEFETCLQKRDESRETRPRSLKSQGCARTEKARKIQNSDIAQGARDRRASRDRSGRNCSQPG